MITKRRLALLTTISAAPVFAAPFLAIGDNAELFLTARTEARYEDNVTFNQDGEQIEDEVFEVAPGAELLFGKNSLTKGSFKASERFSSYSDNTDLNSNLGSLGFDSKYSGSKLDLGANASFRELNQNSPREFAGNVPKGTKLIPRETYNAGLNAEYAVTEKSKVGLAGRYDRTHFKTAGFTDLTSYVVPVNYYFAISEKVDLSTGLQYRKNEVDALNANSDDYYFNVGSRGEFTAKLSGKFNVGYNLRKPEDSSKDDETGLGVNAGLAYAYSPKTNLTLDLSRDFSVASTAAGTQVSSIMLGAATSLTAAWSVNANLGYYQTEYLAGGRTENYLLAGAGVNYVYNEYLNLEAGYVYNNNASDQPSGAGDFTANVIRFAANFRY